MFPWRKKNRRPALYRSTIDRIAHNTRQVKARGWVFTDLKYPGHGVRVVPKGKS